MTSMNENMKLMVSVAVLFSFGFISNLFQLKQ